MSSINNPVTVTAKRRITGQGMTEYIIVVALIAIGAVTAVGVFGEAVQAQFANMTGGLMGAPVDATVAAPTVAAKTLVDFDN